MPSKKSNDFYVLLFAANGDCEAIKMTSLTKCSTKCAAMMRTVHTYQLIDENQGAITIAAEVDIGCYILDGKILHQFTTLCQVMTKDLNPRFMHEMMIHDDALIKVSFKLGANGIATLATRLFEAKKKNST